MKKLLCVVPALLLFAMVGAPNARADSYAPTFTSSCPTCVGFVPTAPTMSFPSPTAIIITLDQTNFGAFPIPSPDAPGDTYSWSYQALVGESAQDTITISDLTDDQPVSETFLGAPVGGVNKGSLMFSPVSASTPEPTPVILMLLGVGLIFFTRKRFMTDTPRTA